MGRDAMGGSELAIEPIVMVSSGWTDDLSNGGRCSSGKGKGCSRNVAATVDVAEEGVELYSAARHQQ